MSAYVLSQEEINKLTIATDAALRMNAKYPGSYPLHDDTVQLLGKYAGDLHNLYRAIYIANIKAVNGRYGEETKTLPKYTKLVPWYTDHGIGSNKLREACYIFDSYMYQLTEDPIYGSPVYNALYDIYKLLALLLAKSLHREEMESRHCANW